MTVLAADGLRVHAGATPIVEGVTFTMAAGQRVGLIGESGSGKTVTALALLGLLGEGLRAEGSVRFAGQDLLTLPERTLARLRGDRLAMVFQEPMTALNPVMTVGNQVAETLRLHRPVGKAEAARRAVELLRMVELPDPDLAARAYPHQLSGGQRQRVMLAIALALDPDVLICDEPTTALDVTVQARMLRLVDRLVAERDTALLFITHDLAVVAGLCEQVLVMYGGRIVESGPVASVFATPRHPYTAGLLAASRATTVRCRLGERLPTIPGNVPNVGAFPSGCPFRDRCDRATEACAADPLLTVDGGRQVRCWHPLEAP